MAFEIVKPEFIPVEDGTQDHSKGNGLSESLTFDSHGPKAVDGPKAHLPKDAVDDWSAQQVHYFYFVRYRQYDDPKIKAKSDVAEKDVRNKMDARSKIIDKIRALRNSCYYVNKLLLNKAKNLANIKDVAALTDISNSELEKFMKMWNESKPFRDDYEKRILVSDGRMRNPDEKPLVVPEPSISVKPEQVTALKPKQTKKETVEKSQEENKTAVKEVRSKEIEAVESEKSVEAEKPKKVEKKVDEAKLKEMRREEELTKAKQAAERKRKLAEKAAAKAAIKAQKEAEKKEKDREKKLKKKGQIPELEEQPTEAEVVESEKPEEVIEEAPTVSKSKSKSRKASSMKNMNRIKGPDSISKVILKCKKSTNYWIWAAPAAVAVMMTFAIGYKYLI